MADLQTTFINYVNENSSELTGSSSVYQKTLNNINTEFDNYGLSAEVKAEYIVQANLRALELVLGSSTSSAMSVITEEKRQELIDSQIEEVQTNITVAETQVDINRKNILLMDEQIKSISKDIEVSDSQISINDKNIENLDSQIELNKSQISINEKSLTKIDSDIELNKSQLDVNDKNIENLDSQIELTNAQEDKTKSEKILTDETYNTQVSLTSKVDNESEKILADVDKVLRDIQGYDDQMIIKMVEQQANLTSFAVNVNSDSSQTAIDNLKCLMEQVMSRTKSLEGQSTCLLSNTTLP